jgi:hypothetical protein
MERFGNPEGNIDEPVAPEQPITVESKEGLPPHSFSFYNNGNLIDSFLGDKSKLSEVLEEFEARNQRKFGSLEGDSFNTEDTKNVIFGG